MGNATTSMQERGNPTTRVEEEGAFFGRFPLPPSSSHTRCSPMNFGGDQLSDCSGSHAVFLSCAMSLCCCGGLSLSCLAGCWSILLNGAVELSDG
eukprot:scaffold201415_cov30-Tisochrysis_lutea.AAC.2